MTEDKINELLHPDTRIFKNSARGLVHDGRRMSPSLAVEYIPLKPVDTIPAEEGVYIKQTRLKSPRR